MRKLITILLACVAIPGLVSAQEEQEQHLLEGTAMNYYYQNGGGVHVEFAEGRFVYKWIAGPFTGSQGSIPYRSRKIGDKQYMVNFYEKDTMTFVTIVFNFNQMMLSTSALLNPGTDQEAILFDGGIIEHLTLHEN